ILATLFFAEAVPFARAGQPARLDSPQHISSNGDESKPPAATDSSSSRTESANSKKEAAVPLEVATPAAQDSGRRTAAPAAEPGQLYFELRYNVDGTDIQGNQDRSFLHPGINHTAEFSFFNNEQVWGNHRLEILAVGRYTNNPQVDPQRNSLQRAYVRLQGPSFEVNLGDALVNFWRLTFNQNVKGLTLSK